MMKELSIIVPVYNVRDTLRPCVESVVCQMPSSAELLLINDGSEDGSGELADALAEEYADRIRVYHKSNGGLSDARNYGIDRAEGEYLTFVDSDDMLQADTLPRLMQILRDDKDCDVLEYGVLVYAGHQSEHRLTLPDRRWATAKEYWETTQAWEHTYACNKIFRRGVFETVRFPKGYVFEDMWVLPEILRQNPVVRTTSQGEYLYVWNPQGISVKVSRHKVQCLLRAQLRAVLLMRTMPWKKGCWSLYRSMLCRVNDIIALSLRKKCHS